MDAYALAWAAGIFEGEGNAKVYHTHVKQFNKTDRRVVAYLSNRPMIQIANTDISLLARFRVIVGVGTIRVAKRSSQRNKLLFHYRVECRKAEPVARMLVPYIVSSNKRNQLKTITDYYDNFSPRKHQGESSKHVWASYSLEERRRRALAISLGRRKQFGKTDALKVVKKPSAAPAS